ncbi:hypothetical protein E8E14_007765 [Neopestalotiopsis sp. 37M]|nr:hypothetical protein E8E14_007765 [Neopestalotiopsis sp. 37M]
MLSNLLRPARVSAFIATIVAKRRFLIALGIPLMILCMLMSGFVVDVDTHTNSNVLNGIRIGHMPSNSSSNGTIAPLKERPSMTYKGYQRPGYELPLAKGIPLRILAVGASTTRGDSPVEVDNNGFRRPLRNRLTALGHKVNFVGTDRLGNMTDNDVLAGPGAQVHIINQMVKPFAVRSKPNVILVNAGTNDCLMHVDIENFYQRYDSLIQYLLMASHRATIVIGTLLPTWNTWFNGREDVFRVNPQLRRLVKIYQKQGLPVVLAEMQGMHPATPGYEMMATKIFQAIVEADARGYLLEPEYSPWIPDDGEEERKHEEGYQRWYKEKDEAYAIWTAHEESEMAKMEAGLEMMRQQRKASG